MEIIKNLGVLDFFIYFFIYFLLFGGCLGNTKSRVLQSVEATFDGILMVESFHSFSSCPTA
jgi:hypothetical protein